MLIDLKFSIVIVTFVVFLFGPIAKQECVGDEEFKRAVEHCRAEKSEEAMVALKKALDSDGDNYQRALLEPAFAKGLRDKGEFRRALREAAVKHSVNKLNLVTDDEPGERIRIETRVVDKDGNPVAGALVLVFNTDIKGRYHPEIEGEEVPKIFGFLVSDKDGKLSFTTIRPGPYPGTRNARHIHVAVRAGDLRLAAPGYVVFDDDPLLKEAQNAEARGEAIRIKMKSVEGKAVGQLTLPVD